VENKKKLHHLQEDPLKYMKFMVQIHKESARKLKKLSKELKTKKRRKVLNFWIKKEKEETVKL
jgi:hypothetical protein